MRRLPSRIALSRNDVGVSTMGILGVTREFAAALWAPLGGDVNTSAHDGTPPASTAERSGASRPASGDVAMSVVIACYNGESTLGMQLDALARQVDAPPFEVVVADNNSTDGSAALARSYADRLDVRVVDASAVKGPGHARNVGVAAARSDYIAFCDADDEVADDWLASAYAALDGGLQFVAGRFDVEKLNSEAIRRSRSTEQQEGLQRSAVGVGLTHAGAGNMAFRRAGFEAVDGFDESLRCLQDSDLCWRMQLAGTPLDFVPAMLIHTRLRSTLQGMIRQGYLYGRSFAQLEGRYGTGEEPAPQASPEASGPLAAVRARVRKAADLGLGGVLWHTAWHIGHRVGKRGVARAAQLPAAHRQAA